MISKKENKKYKLYLKKIRIFKSQKKKNIYKHFQIYTTLIKL